MMAVYPAAGQSEEPVFIWMEASLHAHREKSKILLVS